MEYLDQYKNSVMKRYESDSHFRAMVDLFYYHIADGKFTPTELREAAILAATKFEMLHVRNFVIPYNEMPPEKDPILRHLQKEIIDKRAEKREGR